MNAQQIRIFAHAFPRTLEYINAYRTPIIAPTRGCEFSRRHDPARPKTAEDLERMEAARLKRERKAARKGGAS